jgi:hypothetical protein
VVKIRRKLKEYAPNSASRIFNFIAATFTIIGVILYFVSEETKRFITNLSPYFLLFTLILIIYLLIFQGKLEDIIDEKNKELKTETKGLWNYYGELSKFENEKIIYELLKTFVDSNEFVCGLQLYTYKIFSSKMVFPYLAIQKEGKQKNVTTIKLNYKSGYVREGEDLNAIAQSYYQIEKEILHNFSNKAKLALVQKQPSELISFLKEKIEFLQKKEIDELDDNDAMLFSLIELGMSFIEWRYNLVFDKPLLDVEKVNLLNKKKRTGIANAIINFHNVTGHSWFSFVYKGKGDGKSARKYISYIIENARGEKLLFLISVNTQDEWDSYEEITIHNEIRKNLLRVLENSGILFKKD